MNSDRSFSYMLFSLFMMSLSLTVALIIISAPAWVIALVSLSVFASALSGSISLAFTFKALYNILLRPGLYIWALVAAVCGPQDFFAIAFYIIAGLQVWNIIKNFVGEAFILLAFLRK